jgi:hypothetical protein
MKSFYYVSYSFGKGVYNEVIDADNKEQIKVGLVLKVFEDNVLLFGAKQAKMRARTAVGNIVSVEKVCGHHIREIELEGR